jgi:hypothetical protein
LIAGTDTGALGRRSLHRGDYCDPSVASVFLKAETALISRGPLQMALQVFTLQQCRLGIVELLQQSAGGPEVQLGLGE